MTMTTQRASHGDPMVRPASAELFPSNTNDLWHRSPSATSSAADPQYDGFRENQWRVGSAYDYVYPDLVSDWIKCAICLGPFYEPWAATSTCSHTFCQQCVQLHHRALSDQSDPQRPLPCPSCRTLNRLSDYRAAQPLIRNLVDSLLIFCPLRSRGCEWTGERETVDHHLAKICGYTWIGAVDRDYSIDQRVLSEGAAHEPGQRRKGAKCQCGAQIMRKDWPEHRDKSCTVEWHKCEYCNDVVGACNEEGAHDSHRAICTSVPIECQYCHELISRGQLSHHHAQSCSSIPMSCTMARFGCRWKGPKGSYGLDEGVQGPQEEEAHVRSCMLLPLKVYFQASDERLQQLEAENVALRRDVTRSQIALDANEETLRGCVDALGMWYQRRAREGSSIRNSRHTSVGSRLGASGDSFTGSNASQERFDDMIDWPFAEDNDRHSPPRRGRERSAQLSAGLGESSASDLSPLDEHTEPSRLETTLNDLASSITTLSTQDAALSHLIHDSRRESMYASVEVARLAEEVASLRHGLHGIARHLQLRQSGWRSNVPGVNTGSGIAAGKESNSTPSPSASANVADQVRRSEGTSGARNDRHCSVQVSTLDSGSSGPPLTSLLEGGPFPLPFPPHGVQMPPAIQYPLYQPHFPHLPALTMPMPGVRRFWSGFEQTRL